MSRHPTETSETSLQEIIRRPRTLVPAFVARGGVELGEFAVIVNGIATRLFNRIVHLHNSRLVTATVAVIGSRKDSDYLAIVLPLVAFHHQLMGTRNEVKSVNVRELLRNVLTKGITGSAR